jgi:hypothetical protein
MPNRTTTAAMKLIGGMILPLSRFQRAAHPLHLISERAPRLFDKVTLFLAVNLIFGFEIHP